MSLPDLEPASRSETIVYAPYFSGSKKEVLPLALSLYKTGALEGERRIEGGKSIPFVASWLVSSLPAELTRARLQFEGSAEYAYEISLANSEFIDFLIEIIKEHRDGSPVDFPKEFYRRLLRMEAAF